MPTTTSDQGISMPVDADAADNPVAFVNEVAGIEPRLVRTYINEADRTAKMVSLAENNISGLATENRLDVYNGTNHISLYTRSLFAFLRKTANQILTPSSTALQNVTDLVVAMPAAGSFSFRGIIYYDSSTVADIKIAFNVPAGVTLAWNGLGIVTGSAIVGDAVFSVNTTSDGSASYGASGVGTPAVIQIEGEYVAGGTAGNLQFRAAQATSEASNSTIRALSRLEVWRYL